MATDPAQQHVRGVVAASLAGSGLIGANGLTHSPQQWGWDQEGFAACLLFVATLADLFRAERPLIQVLVGPRQVGKTTGVLSFV